MLGEVHNISFSNLTLKNSLFSILYSNCKHCSMSYRLETAFL